MPDLQDDYSELLLLDTAAHAIGTDSEAEDVGVSLQLPDAPGTWIASQPRYRLQLSDLSWPIKPLQLRLGRSRNLGLKAQLR